MIRIAHSAFPITALTHPGMSGKNNEDRYAVSAYRLSRGDRAPVLLAVLADGIGGHRAGEVAAEIAAERISQVVANSDGSQPVEILRQAILETSQEIHSLSGDDPNHQGMGTTCACIWIIDHHLYTATVGDTRIYLMRGEDIYQLSTDHTWVQEAVEQGILKPELVKGHPNQHIIRRYVGSPNPPEVDFRLRSPYGGANARSEANQGLLLEDGDYLLACTDGLSDLVDDYEIAFAYQQVPFKEASQYLVDLANRRGGHDNITLVAIEIPRRTRLEQWFASNRIWGVAAVAGALLAMVIFVGLVLGFSWLNNRDRAGTPTPPSASAQPTQGLPVVLPAKTLTPVVTATPEAIPTLSPVFTPTPPFTSTPDRPAIVSNTLTPWPTNTLQP
jgi:protein phosphatase